MLIGDPWSAHVSGDGQLNLPQILARAGVEIEAPPFALWIAYVLWQMRADPFGAAPAPRQDAVERARAFESVLYARRRLARRAAGLPDAELPSIDELAALAEPFINPNVRGGYGHVEVGLAVRARLERRAHVVLSVKSFGCIPSSGISDAIVPAALNAPLGLQDDAELPFVALEVSGDAEAARESRLMLRVAAAIDAAERELTDALVRTGRSSGATDRFDDFDPLAFALPVGPRPYACTLACHALRAGSARSFPPTSQPGSEPWVRA